MCNFVGKLALKVLIGYFNVNIILRYRIVVCVCVSVFFSLSDMLVCRIHQDG